MKLRARLTIYTLVIMILGIGVYAYRPADRDHVHYHAGFRVYVDDQLHDFSLFEYMNYTPCSDHDQKESPEDEQIEKAHLHDNVGDVVHVHRSGATWGDLFKNINYKYDSYERVSGYVDGELVENVFESEIAPYTSLILLIDDSDATRSAERVEKSYIEQVEAKSELCGE